MEVKEKALERWWGICEVQQTDLHDICENRPLNWKSGTLNPYHVMIRIESQSQTQENKEVIRCQQFFQEL